MFHLGSRKFLEPLHGSSLHELINLGADGGTKALNVLDVFTAGDIEVQFTKLLLGDPIGLRLVVARLEVAEFEEALSEFRVSLHLEKIINLLGDGLADTRQLHGFLTTDDRIRKVINL